MDDSLVLGLLDRRNEQYLTGGDVWPDGHGVHEVAPTPLYVFAGQVPHCPFWVYWPALHVVESAT